MYTIEDCGPSSKLTEAHELPYDKAFTLEGFNNLITIRVEPNKNVPSGKLTEDTVTLIEFNKRGGFVSLFIVKANYTYQNVVFHDFNLQLLS